MSRQTIFSFLAVVAVLLLGFLGALAMQPPEYRVERSAIMAAPPAAVFAQVNDFHKWNDWSPWAKLDPSAKNSFEGPESGQGSVFHWAGNDQVGEGHMKILESRPPEYVRIQLAFIKPFQDSANVEFKLQPEGEHTRVIWSMDGKNTFMGKIICLFMNMDKMVGDSYAEGLANIKTIVEAAPGEKEPEAKETTAKTEATSETKTEN